MLTDKEKLAVAQAMYRACAAVVSTKDPDSLRSLCDADMLENYASTGAKSYDMLVAGQKVGTYSVRVSKARDELVVVDEHDMKRWAIEQGFIVPTVDWDAVKRHFAETGEVPDGCEVEHTPERASGTTLKVDETKVADALGAELPAAVRGLLEGSE